MSDSTQGRLDNDSEQNLLEQADLADAVKILRQRIRAADSGEPGVPAEVVLTDIKQRLKRATKQRSLILNRCD